MISSSFDPHNGYFWDGPRGIKTRLLTGLSKYSFERSFWRRRNWRWSPKGSSQKVVEEGCWRLPQDNSRLEYRVRPLEFQNYARDEWKSYGCDGYILAHSNNKIILNCLKLNSSHSLFWSLSQQAAWNYFDVDHSVLVCDWNVWLYREERKQEIVRELSWWKKNLVVWTLDNFVLVPQTWTGSLTRPLWSVILFTLVWCDLRSTNRHVRFSWGGPTRNPSAHGRCFGFAFSATTL